MRKAIIPFIVLIVLTFISHLLPVESGERIGFSMTSILTMIITIQYISDQLPETDEKPDIMYYGELALFSMIASLLMTTLILDLYHKKRKPMACTSRQMLSIACRILFVKHRRKNLIPDIEMKDDVEESNDWTALAHLIDRLSLMTFFVITSVVIINFT